MLLTVPPLDMLAFLAISQILPMVLLKEEVIDARVAYLVLASQICLILTFFLVWGGYARDSWDYLMAFGDPKGNPFDRNRDWLFWWLGKGLSWIVEDPWPLKIISAFSAALICSSVLMFFGRTDVEYAVAGLFLVLLVPSFLLLMGSAVRQGLAGAIVVVGLACLYTEKERSFWICTILAVLCHVSAIVLALAGLFSKKLPRWVLYVFCLAPVVSLLMLYIGPATGLEEYVPYTDISEGEFHLEKFVLAYTLASIAYLLSKKTNTKDSKVLVTYVYMVGFSGFFVVYEIPFERLLGYSELLIPMVGAVCVKTLSFTKRQLRILWVCGFAFGFLLWSHSSIVYTLGYSGGYEYCC